MGNSFREEYEQWNGAMNSAELEILESMRSRAVESSDSENESVWDNDDTEKLKYDGLLINGYIRHINDWLLLNHIIPPEVNLICNKFYHIPGPFIKQSTSSETYNKHQNIITIGDKVKVKHIGMGRVKFIGEIDDKIGIFYGIELFGKKNIVGLTNGSLNNKVYFKTKQDKNKGIFVRRDVVKNIEINVNNLRVTVGNIVRIRKYECNGIIRFIGYTEFKPNIIWYGIKLNKAKGKNNGNINNQQTLSTLPGFAYFIETHRLSVYARLGSRWG
eukprot:378718_1